MKQKLQIVVQGWGIEDSVKLEKWRPRQDQPYYIDVGHWRLGMGKLKGPGSLCLFSCLYSCARQLQIEWLSHNFQLLVHVLCPNTLISHQEIVNEYNTINGKQSMAIPSYALNRLWLHCFTVLTVTRIHHCFRLSLMKHICLQGLHKLV